MNHPKPDQSYVRLQRDHAAANGRGIKLQRELEKKFMAAWGFAPDRLRLSYKLRERLTSPGLDHCEFYTGPSDERIIVTQPYGDFADSLKQDFTLDNDVGPVVIKADDWAFHCPGHASLVILIFPPDYVKLREESVARRRKAERRAALASAEKALADRALRHWM